MTQALAVPEPAKRQPMYRRMQEIVLTEWPVLPIVNPMAYQAVRKRLHNTYLAFDTTVRGLLESWIE